MAASLCRCQLDVPGKSIASNSQISSSQEEAAPRIVSFGNENSVLAVSLRTESNRKSSDELCDRSFRWTAKATAAFATLTLIAAAPTTVLAAEVDFSSPSAQTQAIPGDRSLSIAIPIPDQGTWLFAQSGFVAPPPRDSVGGGRAVVTRNPMTGGCPSWNPVNFEMVVPDGVRPKTFPRQGSQWSALYIIEDETQSIYSEVIEASDPDVVKLFLRDEYGARSSSRVRESRFKFVQGEKSAEVSSKVLIFNDLLPTTDSTVFHSVWEKNSSVAALKLPQSFSAEKFGEITKEKLNPPVKGYV